MSTKNNDPKVHDALLRLEHKKRLAQILRYIANMHQSLSLSGNSSSVSNTNDSNNTMNATTTSFFIERGPVERDVPNFFHYTENDISIDDQRQKKLKRTNSTDNGSNNNTAFILFTTDNFRTLLTIQDELGDLINEANAPFNFYAAGRVGGHSPSSNVKQSATSPFGYFKRGEDSKKAKSSGGCWMRLTRMSSNITSKHLRRPAIIDARIRNYLEDWLVSEQQHHQRSHRTNRTSNKRNDDDQVQSIEDLLTLKRLKDAPKIPPSVGEQGAHRIKSFLLLYQKYLKSVLYQKRIETLYNRLFQWMQDSSNNTNELVWGLGHAQVLLSDDESSNVPTLVNGPLLEVMVQVELSQDGALLIRPRNHTGVVLNREVTSALMKSEHTSSVLASLHAATAELDPAELSPGQPGTYVPFLKRIALELSSNGLFQASASVGATGKQMTPNRLLVTEAWCVYSRPKPNSVWARDATAFADRLFSSVSTDDMTTNSSASSAMIISQATLAFTHGPASLDRESISLKSRERSSSVSKSNPVDWIHSFLGWTTHDKLIQSPNIDDDKAKLDANANKPIFPLPSSDSQNRIANLLLSKDYPAVVCEGPPGTGKSHTIANMICSYLCQGKRVLVTSKNSPALRVLRYRLPKTVQELCVDVSSSESEGMRHLQQTVEKLAMRIASVNTDVEYQKYVYLKATIRNLEKEIDDIDAKLSQRSEKVQNFVRTHDGQQLVSLAISLSDLAPWLTKTMPYWSMEKLIEVKHRTERLVLEQRSALDNISGYIRPITDDLIAYISCKAGLRSIASLSNSAKTALANVPLIGNVSGLKQRSTELESVAEKLLIRGLPPHGKSEWMQVLEIVKWIQSVDEYHVDIWCTCQRKHGWPEKDFLANPDDLQEIATLLDKCMKIKEYEHSSSVEIDEHMRLAAECRLLDARRSVLSTKVQSLAEELVDATVVSELSQNFSSDAQSALIRFAQLAGKQNFSQTTKLSKLSQRQRRRRQDYLDAFDRCCRFIPCWIMTTSQISDYLPPECLFDLAIIDESSQSDITALTGMLRGRQWLIVGDGKQVSPTETFMSEDSLESLRASLPPVPFASSMLPGQSFFDLCAQAFPRGRVVLNEHFRCAPEIISFSNTNFYNDELVSMRLPTKTERIDPSILDVRVPTGRKMGKSNREEADAIIKHIAEIVSKSPKDSPRSIGVISLMGSEQSQMIRSGLLETIGPHEIARHDILVGDPPTFQGTERDIVFLSMVCSKGSSPTQSQLMHFQRANVAMSRARDQLILYRSIDIQDIASPEDMKIPILEFFAMRTTVREVDSECKSKSKNADKFSPSVFLQHLLVERGYNVQSMGRVWKKGISIESTSSDTRVGLIVECDEDSLQEWYLSYKQQKAIERVGWKCMRIDAISLACRPNETLDTISRFLKANGIDDPLVIYDQLDDESKASDPLVQPLNGEDVQNDGSSSENEETMDDEPRRDHIQGLERVDDHTGCYVVVSSDEDEGPASKKRMRRTSHMEEFDSTFQLDASNFGETVGMDFLMGKKRKTLTRAGIGHLPNDKDDITFHYDDEGSQKSWSDDVSIPKGSNSEGNVERRRGRPKEKMNSIENTSRSRKKKKLMESKDSKRKDRERAAGRKFKSGDENSEEDEIDGTSHHTNESGCVDKEAKEPDNQCYSPRRSRLQVNYQEDEQSIDAGFDESISYETDEENEENEI